MRAAVDVIEFFLVPAKFLCDEFIFSAFAQAVHDLPVFPDFGQPTPGFLNGEAPLFDRPELGVDGTIEKLQVSIAQAQVLGSKGAMILA